MNIIYRFTRFIFWLFGTIFFRAQGHHVERLPLSGGGLMVLSNHASNLDPPLLGIFTNRRLCSLAKQELFRIPLFGPWARRIGVLPINRTGVDRKALGRAIDVLKEGNALLIFPEGTRTNDGNLQEGKPGVAMIAVQAGVPCIPVYIDGSYRAWSRGRLFPRFCKIHVWYGNVFTLPERPESMSTKEYYQLCADSMMQRIDEVRREAEESKTPPANGSRS